MSSVGNLFAVGAFRDADEELVQIAITVERFDGFLTCKDALGEDDGFVEDADNRERCVLALEGIANCDLDRLHGRVSGVNATDAEGRVVAVILAETGDSGGVDDGALAQSEIGAAGKSPATGVGAGDIGNGDRRIDRVDVRTGHVRMVTRVVSSGGKPWSHRFRCRGNARRPSRRSRGCVRCCDSAP